MLELNCYVACGSSAGALLKDTPGGADEDPEECLRRIAAKLCLLDSVRKENDHEQAEIGDKQTIAGNKPPVTGCCTSSGSGGDYAPTTTCPSVKGAGDVEAPCASIEATGDCMDNGARVEVDTSRECSDGCFEKDPRISRPGENESDCCDDTGHALDNLSNCQDECCDLLGERSVADIATACNAHLAAISERFGALVERQLCICRMVVEQLGFCCCLLSSDGKLMTNAACSGSPSVRAVWAKKDRYSGREGLTRIQRGSSCSQAKSIACKRVAQCDEKAPKSTVESISSCCQMTSCAAKPHDEKSCSGDAGSQSSPPATAGNHGVKHQGMYRADDKCGGGCCEMEPQALRRGVHANKTLMAAARRPSRMTLAMIAFVTA